MREKRIRHEQKRKEKEERKKEKETRKSIIQQKRISEFQDEVRRSHVWSSHSNSPEPIIKEKKETIEEEKEENVIENTNKNIRTIGSSNINYWNSEEGHSVELPSENRFRTKTPKQFDGTVLRESEVTPDNSSTDYPELLNDKKESNNDIKINNEELDELDTHRSARVTSEMINGQSEEISDFIV